MLHFEVGIPVSKMNLSLVSLVAAIPAGFLAFLLVNVFLTYAGASSPAGLQTTIPTMAYVFVGLALATSAVLVLMPIGVVVLGPKSEKKAKPAKDDDVDSGELETTAAAGEGISDEIEVDDDIEVEEVEDDELLVSEGDEEVDEFGLEDEEIVDEAIEVDDDEAVAEIEVDDEFDAFDEFEFEEEDDDAKK